MPLMAMRFTRLRLREGGLIVCLNTLSFHRSVSLTNLAPIIGLIERLS